MFVRTLNENARDNISKLAEFESQSAKSIISEMKTLSDTANGFQIDINAADKIVAEVL